MTSVLTFANRSVITRDHLDIAHLACPAGLAQTLVAVSLLSTLGSVHARLYRAPVHVRLTELAGVAVRTVARVVLDVVHACASVSTGRRVTLVDTRLAVAPRVPVEIHHSFKV